MVIHCSFARHDQHSSDNKKTAKKSHSFEPDRNQSESKTIKVRNGQDLTTFFAKLVTEAWLLLMEGMILLIAEIPNNHLGCMKP